MKEQVTELRPRGIVQADDFSIENGPSGVGQKRLYFLAKVCERIEGMAVPRDQLAATILDDGERPKPVVLQNT